MVIVLIVVLVLFGSSKLPGLARSLGEAQRELRNAGRETSTTSVERSSER
jgi:TatA/E family protein of Tat protein translocase